VAVVLLMLYGGALFAGGYFTNELTGDGDESPAVAQPTPSPTATPPAVVGDVSADDDPALGPPDAKVLMVEFSDYQWGYCKRFRDETLDRLLETYGDDLRFVYRDYPIASHTQAAQAAEAAECADDQGQFWEYQDLIWANRVVDTDSLKGYAAQLGLDTATFNDCLDSGKNKAEVEKDYQDGQSYGVSATPTFFINGQLVRGAKPFEEFKAVIDAALAEAGGGGGGSPTPASPSGSGSPTPASSGGGWGR
jgi:protein-disulfide isomerase